MPFTPIDPADVARIVARVCGTPCPGCGAPVAAGDLTWPITVAVAVVGGGCDACWEAECAAAWWDALPTLSALRGVPGFDPLPSLTAYVTRERT